MMRALSRFFPLALLTAGAGDATPPPSFPIAGDPRKAYDSYLEQLTADAKAAVDKAVETGVVDPDRIGTTRFVMLPHEPHHYTALESNEQLVYEEIRWFDRYVKNAPPLGEIFGP